MSYLSKVGNKARFCFLSHSSPDYDRELADMKALLKKDSGSPSPNIGKNRKSADSKSVNSMEPEPEQGEFITINVWSGCIQNQKWRQKPLRLRFSGFVWQV